jgi:hypothetical protein
MNAIREWNWKKKDNWIVRVSRAKPSINKVSVTNLYVENIPVDWNDQMLSEYVSRICKITEARLLIDRKKGVSRGVGFLHCASNAEAKKAIRWFSKERPEDNGVKLNVKFANIPRSDRYKHRAPKGDCQAKQKRNTNQSSKDVNKSGLPTPTKDSEPQSQESKIQNKEKSNPSKTFSNHLNTYSYQGQLIKTSNGPSMYGIPTVPIPDTWQNKRTEGHVQMPMPYTNLPKSNQPTQLFMNQQYQTPQLGGSMVGNCVFHSVQSHQLSPPTHPVMCSAQTLQPIEYASPVVTTATNMCSPQGPTPLSHSRPCVSMQAQTPNVQVNTMYYTVPVPHTQYQPLNNPNDTDTTNKSIKAKVIAGTQMQQYNYNQASFENGLVGAGTPGVECGQHQINLNPQVGLQSDLCVQPFQYHNVFQGTTTAAPPQTILGNHMTMGNYNGGGMSALTYQQQGGYPQQYMTHVLNPVGMTQQNSHCRSTASSCGTQVRTLKNTNQAVKKQPAIPINNDTKISNLPVKLKLIPSDNCSGCNHRGVSKSPFAGFKHQSKAKINPFNGFKQKSKTTKNPFNGFKHNSKGRKNSFNALNIKQNLATKPVTCSNEKWNVATSPFTGFSRKPKMEKVKMNFRPAILKNNHIYTN